MMFGVQITLGSRGYFFLIDICGEAALTRRKALPRNISIRKKYPLEPRVGTDKTRILIDVAARFGVTYSARYGRFCHWMKCGKECCLSWKDLRHGLNIFKSSA